MSRSSLLEATRRLWAGRVQEQHMAAVLLLEQYRQLLEAGDLPLLEEMIRGSFGAGVTGGGSGVTPTGCSRVESYVRQRLARMSGITFREAVKRLPEERQEALRHAYRSSRR